jgi:hypothetical protein
MGDWNPTIFYTVVVNGLGESRIYDESTERGASIFSLGLKIVFRRKFVFSIGFLF